MPPGDLPAGAFEFATAARIVFGPGRIRELPALTRTLGSRALVVVGSNTSRHEAVFAGLRSVLEHVEVVPTRGEPTVLMAEEAAARARDSRCEVVVALGGGSVIDAGKAAAALAANPGPALDYLEVVGRGRALPHASLPVIAVPTTAGTGAEVTRNAVLAVPAARVKVSLRSPHMLPRVALVDPELSIGLPPELTAATGMDALTQLIEAYLSCRANACTAALCVDGLRRAAGALPRVFAFPSDLEARSEMALAALFSGIALANAGLGVVHGLAGPIGGRFAAPHGAVCAALLPHGLRANLQALRTRQPDQAVLERFATLAGLLTSDPSAGADDAVTWVVDLVARLGIPPLRRWGLGAADVGELVSAAAQASSTKGNPVALTEAELERILREAL